MPKKKAHAQKKETVKKSKMTDPNYYHKRAEDQKRHPSKG